MGWLGGIKSWSSEVLRPGDLTCQRQRKSQHRKDPNAQGQLRWATRLSCCEEKLGNPATIKPKSLAKRLVVVCQRLFDRRQTDLKSSKQFRRHTTWLLTNLVRENIEKVNRRINSFWMKLKLYLSPNLDLNEITRRCQASRFDNCAQQVIADEFSVYRRYTGLLSSLDTYIVATSLFVYIVV